MTCPQCGSSDLRVDPFEDHDASTGYRDFGVRITCRVCGAVSTEAEMDRAAEKPSAEESILRAYLESLPEPVYVAPPEEISLEDLLDAMPECWW